MNSLKSKPHVLSEKQILESSDSDCTNAEHLAFIKSGLLELYDLTNDSILEANKNASALEYKD